MCGVFLLLNRQNRFGLRRKKKKKEYADRIYFECVELNSAKKTVVKNTTTEKKSNMIIAINQRYDQMENYFN